MKFVKHRRVSDNKRLRYLAAARAVFLRYGYKRANMNDISQAAGISRAALYLAFKNKEEIFVGVLDQWVDEIIAEVRNAIAANLPAKEKLQRAFEIWAVRPYDMICASAEARELLECNFDFAQASLQEAFGRFAATIAPLIAASVPGGNGVEYLAPERTAHILISAVHGLKHTAKTSGELRQLIEDLLFMTLPYPLVDTASHDPLRAGKGPPPM